MRPRAPGKVFFTRTSSPAHHPDDDSPPCSPPCCGKPKPPGVHLTNINYLLFLLLCDQISVAAAALCVLKPVGVAY